MTRVALHSSGGGVLVPLLLALLPLLLAAETGSSRRRSPQQEQQAHQRPAMSKASRVMMSGCSSSNSAAFCSSTTWPCSRFFLASSKKKHSFNLRRVLPVSSGCGCGGDGGDSTSSSSSSSSSIIITPRLPRGHRRLWSTTLTEGSAIKRAVEDAKAVMMMMAFGPATVSSFGAEEGKQQQQPRQPGATATAAAASASATAIVVPSEPAETTAFDSLKQSKAAGAYYNKRREAMGAWNEERRGRDLCERCRRARKMCLCSSLPAAPLPTSTRFVILQHPAETKKRITGTVPLVLHCLANCRRVVMRSEYSEEDLRKVLGIKSGGSGGVGDKKDGAGDLSSSESSLENSPEPLLLFPCPGAEYLEDIAAVRKEEAAAAAAAAAVSYEVPAEWPPSSSPLPPPPSSSLAEPLVVVLIDGTWSQAKQILSRYPFLSPRPPSGGAAGPGGRGWRRGAKQQQQQQLVPGTTHGSSPRTAERGGSSGGDGAGGSVSFEMEDEEQGTEGGRGSSGQGVREGEVGDEEQVEEEEEEEGEGAGAERTEKQGGAFCRAVQFRSAGASGYGFRREPSKECLSTLESIAYTLEVLEGTPEGESAAKYLRKSFAAMVAMQVEAASAAAGRPRFVNRKARTANRRSTPKKNC